MPAGAGQDSNELPLQFALIPATTPPPGITPNFENVEPMLYITISTLSVCIVVCTTMVILRLSARLCVVKVVDWSDYSALLGYAFSLAFMGLVLEIDHKRRGRHMWDMSALDYLRTTKQENVATIMYCFGITFSKLSILFFYFKIFMPTRRGAVYRINVVLCWLNVIFYAVCVCILVFQCTPRDKISNPTIEGYCMDVYMIFLVTGICNILSDFFILAFPIWAVWHLQMPLTRKLHVSIIFGFGAFAVLASIMRLRSTTQLPMNKDISWVKAKMGMWIAAEMTTILLCACFPFIPRLFRPQQQRRSSRSSRVNLARLQDHSTTRHDLPRRGDSENSLGRASVVEHTGLHGPEEHVRSSKLAWKQPPTDSTALSADWKGSSVPDADLVDEPRHAANEKA